MGEERIESRNTERGLEEESDMYSMHMQVSPQGGTVTLICVSSMQRWKTWYAVTTYGLLYLLSYEQANLLASWERGHPCVPRVLCSQGPIPTVSN